MIFCGLGGQGILFMTKIFARAALDKGLATLGAETHGMAQRGGSVVSHLKLGTAASSLVREQTAGFLLALEGERGLPQPPLSGAGWQHLRKRGRRCFSQKGRHSLSGKTEHLLPCLPCPKNGHGTRESHEYQSGADGVLYRP